VSDADAHQDGDDNASQGGDARARRDGDAVVVRDVEKRYRRTDEVTVEALSSVSLSLAGGSYTAVMGPSGSGKSTLLNLVGGLDTPTAGSVAVDSTELSSLSEPERARVRGEEVGFVFQTFNLMPRLTAAENVAFPLVFRGVDRAERLDRARELLADVGLADRTDHRPNELSGGQRQRVAIARALAGDPTLVLADEPTGNVDTGTGDRVMSVLRRVNDAGNTILLVTHERHIAERADRIVHLRDGEIRDVEPVEGTGSGSGSGSGTGEATTGDR
jgi:putative ABC transport system ATP-binding protein